jgi:hypothetical protein
MAVNGRAEALCVWHAQPESKGPPGNSVKHGFYVKGETDRLDWVGREAPSDVVQLGGLRAMPPASIEVRERQMDLHPPEPKEVDADTAIAGLVHKMEIIDKLIFQASERGLDVVRLLEIYTMASSRLAKMLRDRQALEAEDSDLERLIDAALDYAEGQGRHGE